MQESNLPCTLLCYTYKFLSFISCTVDMPRSTNNTAFCMFVGVCSDKVQDAIVLSITIMYNVTLPISQTSITFPFVAICKNIEFNDTIYQLPF